jgi:hypothetical protein
MPISIGLAFCTLRHPQETTVITKITINFFISFFRTSLLSRNTWEGPCVHGAARVYLLERLVELSRLRRQILP